ncbi:MAG TPA: glycine oxidase ThiO [Candidatus Binataceae bacterium]|nr:glycine oxidase ThiO [Candidatus Binataceae bacterium]
MRVVIIGGGIIGGSIAWALARAGLQATILERARAGQEASWAAAGLLAPQAEAEGPGPFLHFCVEAKRAFEEILEQLIADSGIDPEYEPTSGVLYVALNEEERAELSRRAIWQRQAGLMVEELSAPAARAIVPQLSLATCAALYFRHDYRAENRKLTQAYLMAALRAGARLREESAVDRLLIQAGQVRGVVLIDGSEIEADAVVNAAGAWASQVKGAEVDRVNLFPIRGQILCFEALPTTLPVGLFSLRGYVVPRRDGRLLAGSTRERAGFSKYVTVEGMARIARGVRDLLPEMADLRFNQAWAGLRPAAEDLLPVLGPSPNLPGLYYAAGHFRSGVLLSAITGQIIAALLCGSRPRFDIAPFSPARFAKRG